MTEQLFIPNLQSTSIGFTGSRRGMTYYQKIYLQKELERIITPHSWPNNTQIIKVIDGMCMGADDEFSLLCQSIGKVTTIGFPAFKNHYSSKLPRDIVFPEQDFLKRNKKIVDSSSCMFACPITKEDVIKSGTWSTIRYTIKSGKALTIILPDGKMQKFNIF